MAEGVQLLPWAFYEYDEINDPAWNHEDDAPQNAKPADIPDWYAIDYARKNDTIPKNLAQLVYEATGCLMPRDLHRYDHELKELGKFGLRQNKAVAILYCMNALGAARHMKLANKYDEIYMEHLLSEKDDIPVSAADNGPIQKTEEQKEIERLKAALHAAERDAANAKKKLSEQKFAAEAEHRELADLRELLCKEIFSYGRNPRRFGRRSLINDRRSFCLNHF